MATKADLQEWVLEALSDLGGSGRVLDVSKIVWKNHGADLKASGDLFYTWQYDLRWAAHRLRKAGKMKSADDRAMLWEIA